MNDLRQPPGYLNPAVPRGVRRVAMPVVHATDETLRGYGRLVDDPADCEIEIVRWPAQGWRPVDSDSGRRRRDHTRNAGSQRLHDEQGTVHARVSVGLPRELSCLLEAPLR